MPRSEAGSNLRREKRMHVAAIAEFEYDRKDGQGTLAVSMRVDLDEIVQAAGGRLWDHVDIKDVAEHFGTDVIDHLSDNEVLDGFSVAEKLANAAVEEVISWMENQGYTVTRGDEDMVMVSRSTLEALRTVVGAAGDLLEELDAD